MMRAQNEPRRIYSRNNVTHVCYGGVYFSPGREGTAINTEREVKIEVLDPVGGRKRIQVTQRVGKRTLKETWREVTVPVTHRATA
jgi:hypothetical protein